jgi:hypothetical protein
VDQPNLKWLKSSLLQILSESYSGFQAQVVRPLVPMLYAPRPAPTRIYSSQPGTAIALIPSLNGAGQIYGLPPSCLGSEDF